MFAFCFECVSCFKKIFGLSIISWDYISYLHDSACDGSGFIEGNNLSFAGHFLGSGCLKQDSVFCTNSVADHNRNRSRKSKRTRTADYQNRNCACHCITNGLSNKKPDNKSHCRNSNNSWNKYSRNLICNFSDRSLSCCGITYHADNSCKGSVFTNTGSFANKEARSVDRSGRNSASSLLFYRKTFASEGCFVYCTLSFNYNSINRNTVAWANNKMVPDFDFFNRHCFFGSISSSSFNKYRSFRSHLHKRLKGVCSFSF